MNIGMDFPSKILFPPLSQYIHSDLEVVVGCYTLCKNTGPDHCVTS